MFFINRSIVWKFTAVIFLIAFLVVASSFMLIYKSVKETSVKAKKRYEGKCAESLILTIQDKDKSIREKNRAVYALGQLADKKALAFLEKLNNSLKKQDRCSYDLELCKYEV